MTGWYGWGTCPSFTGHQHPKESRTTVRGDSPIPIKRSNILRIASINLNKRLGNPAVRAKLTAWLHHHHVDILVAQEPRKPVNRTAINLTDYRPVDGNGDLFCWSVERFTIPPVSRPDTFVQRLELGWLVLYNTYLDCDSTTSRHHQLRRFQEIIAVENGRPILACGDFNLAPRPVDGLNNGRPSKFNSTRDASGGATPCCRGRVAASSGRLGPGTRWCAGWGWR